MAMYNHALKTHHLSFCNPFLKVELGFVHPSQHVYTGGKLENYLSQLFGKIMRSIDLDTNDINIYELQKYAKQAGPKYYCMAILQEVVQHIAAKHNQRILVTNTCKVSDLGGYLLSLGGVEVIYFLLSHSTERLLPLITSSLVGSALAHLVVTAVIHSRIIQFVPDAVGDDRYKIVVEHVSHFLLTICELLEQIEKTHQHQNPVVSYPYTFIPLAACVPNLLNLFAPKERLAKILYKLNVPHLTIYLFDFKQEEERKRCSLFWTNMEIGVATENDNHNYEEIEVDMSVVET